MPQSDYPKGKFRGGHRVQTRQRRSCRHTSCKCWCARAIRRRHGPRRCGGGSVPDAVMVQKLARAVQWIIVQTRMSKRRRHRHASSPRRRDLPLAELLGIVERAKAGALNEADCRHAQVSSGHLGLPDTGAFGERDDDRRLRKMLFGRARRDQPVHRRRHRHWWHCGPRWRAGRRRHGWTVARTSRSDRAWPQWCGGVLWCHQDQVPHPSLARGDSCPECQKGKVYLLSDPAVLVRVVGMAPLSATVYEQERLRCNLCGEVFTAPAPTGLAARSTTRRQRR